ncbi:hypothetical protein sr20015 [Sporisorium reilianum SRZ2]|nr:hypothetical protein sr20015 [Sporisorium reilianum SRZ2]
MHFCKARLFWALVAFASLSLVLGQAGNRREASQTGPFQGASTSQGSSRAVPAAGDAGGYPDGHLNWPETQVPRAVMRQLVTKFHGIRYHVPYIPPRYNAQIVNDKLKEVLHNRYTRIST